MYNKKCDCCEERFLIADNTITTCKLCNYLIENSTTESKNLFQTVDIISMQDDEFEDDNRYKGTYLHGRLEKEIGYDIFSFKHKLYINPGEHHFMHNQEEVIFYLWKTKGSDQEYRGFLVYANDKDAVRHALGHYTKKSWGI